MASSPLIIKHHVPGVDIATVWAWVSASVFRERALPTMGSTLKSNRDWIDAGGSSQFDTYIFKGFDAMEEKTDMMRALFVPVLSSGGVAPTTPVRTFLTTEDYYWPAVLTSAIDFTTFTSFDGTTWTIGGTPNQYSRWGIFPKMRAAYRGLTQVQIDDYISEVSWATATYTVSANVATLSTDGIRKESLHPNRVFWDLVTDKQSLPECLMAAGYATTPLVQEKGTTNTIVPAKTFDATPQTTWVDHVFEDVVTFADGLYFRRRKTAIVPPSTPGVS